MRELIPEVEYADVSGFSEHVLHPALDAGHSLSVFTPFVPSYLIELVTTLRATEKIESGKINLVLGIPNIPGFFDSPVKNLAGYFRALQNPDSVLESFVKNLIFLVAENSLSVKFLIARETRVLSSGCVGLLEDGSGKSDFAVLQDFLEGDSNSPIRPICSWKSENPEDFRDVLDLLGKVFFGDSPEGLVIQQVEAVAFLREIVSKSWLSGPKTAKQKRANPAKRPKARVASADDDDDELLFDEIDSDDFWSSLDQNWDELVALSTSSEISGESLTDLLDAFGLDDLPIEWELILDRSKRIKEGFGDDFL